MKRPAAASLRASNERTTRRGAPLDLNCVPDAVQEVMRGYYLDYPPTVLLPHTFLPQELQVPDADLRLVRAANTLLRATGTTVVRGRCEWSRKVYCRLSLLHDLVTDHGPQFYFYVAGGFVVSELLGFGEWKDIDVWTQPFPVDDAAWAFRVAAGKGVYPVKSLAVSHMESFVESFDLHITACAVLCCMFPDGTRGFELYLTKNCAMAYKMRAVHSCTIHRAVADAPRLRDRILKFRERGVTEQRRLTTYVSGSYSDKAVKAHARATNGAASLLFVTQGQSAPCTSARGQWLLQMTEGFLCSIFFSFDRAAAAETTVPASLPVVCYPCYRAMPGSMRSERPQGSHWLFELMSHGTHASLLAFRGGTRIVTTSLLPEWLVDRIHLTRPQLERELLHTFAARLSESGCGVVPIACSLPVRLLRFMSNWNGGSSLAAKDETQVLGGDSWCFMLDAPWQRSLRGVMFCRDTGNVVEECIHAHRCDYTLHGGQCH